MKILLALAMVFMLAACRVPEKQELETAADTIVYQQDIEQCTAQPDTVTCR